MKAAAAAAFAAVLALVPAPEARAQPAPRTDDPVIWKMGSAFPSELVQLGSLGKSLERNVEQVSGGRMRLVFHEPGVLSRALELFEAVRDGTVDAAWSTPGYWQDREPALALFAAVPFGPRAGEYVAWMYHGGGQKLMNEIYARHGLHALLCGVIAPEAAGWFRKQIRTVEDLEGLRIRFFGLGARVMEKLGAETRLIAGDELYAALENGDIDAVEFSMPAIDQNLRLHEFASHYYFPGWHQQATLFELLMNKDKWEALDADSRAMLKVACKANVTDGLAEGEAIQAKALAALKKKRVRLHRWPPEILKRLKVAWRRVAAEQATADKTFARVWRSLLRFRKGYAQWKDLGYLD